MSDGPSEPVDPAAAARERIDRLSLPTLIEVDGGIEPENVGVLVRAGVDVLVVGSGLYQHPGGLPAGVEALRQAAEAA